MKTKRVIIYITVMFLLSLAAFAQVVNLSNLPRTPSNHPWVLAYDNKVIVVWREEGGYSGMEKNIYYTINAGNGWSKPKAAFTSTVYSKNPHLALGPDGTVHLTWADGNARPSREVYHGTYKNGIWSNKSEIYNSPNNSNWPRVGVMSGNVANIIWTSEIGNSNEHYVLRNNWKIGSWNRSGNLVSDNTAWTGETNFATHNDLVCQDNKAYAVWQQGSETVKHIYFAEKEGTGNWSLPLDISGGKFTTYPGICVDSTGNLHVIAAGLGGNVWSTSRLNGEWTKIRRVNDEDNIRGFVDIDVDKYDNLHAVYQVGPNIYYNSGNSMGVWGNELQVSEEKESHFPAISVDNQGYAHIVWCTADEGFNGEVKYKRIEVGGVPSVNAPVAIFNFNPEFGKPPLKVTFNAAQSYDSDGSIVSYSWSFGDGSTGGGVNPSHTYTKRGAYVVTLTVKDNNGLPGTTQSTVFVSDPPVARFTMTPSLAVAPAIIHFDASQSSDPDGNIVQYVWYFDDGGNGVGRTTTHTYYEPGDYNVSLEVFDDFGLSAMSSQILRIMRIHPPANIAFSFKINRNLFIKEYFYHITWDKNPLNDQSGVNVLYYKVYRRVKGQLEYVNIATLKSDKREYWDRGLEETDENRFQYTVTAVDGEGNESLIDMLYNLDTAPQNKQTPGNDNIK